MCHPSGPTIQGGTYFPDQEFQGNQCTQKLQTTNKFNDPQQPQTSESTDTTAPGAQRSSEVSGCQARQLQGDQYTKKLQTTEQSDNSQQPQTSENINTTAPGDQHSRKKSTVQSQESQGNRCTQKPQTTKQPSDLQQPPTSKSTVTTAPSQSSRQPQTFESTEVTVPSTDSECKRRYKHLKEYPYIQHVGFSQQGCKLWVTRKIFWSPQRFISLEADFLGQPIPGPYEEALWAACLHHPHCDVYEEFRIEPLDVSRDGTRLRAKFARPGCPPESKPIPAHLRGLPSTYCQSWTGGLNALDAEGISDFVLADADQANLPIIPLLVLQLAVERAANPPPLAADSKPKKKVTVSEKEIPQDPKHQVHRHKKFPVLRNLSSLGVCLLPMFWWQRYKKSRQL
ncbi:uncharacterized protein BO95DRAFT_172260 [Aspergillus brunneoviolaceus CBS 621.78]|uniref:Uncharacterized protein n=1 Tax=Aspergillus brunneoviolaceus CBS 621.78 TaxID=1450534 RepID=A0ACD1G5D9_9EURO|nr:hypothetical protein BO95DRAFT_172260 [Aspergillus brunneoviolaceus CBS 621.78]RAH44435.1 hypothetical protein BO95DRAFT_172260 [Aspergillus brunneoviolaceus CBS 621.78]